MTRTAPLLLLVLALAGCYQRTEDLPRPVADDPRPVLRLGIVPTRTPRDELLRYGALGDALGERVNRRIEVRPAATLEILRRRLEAGHLDLAVMGPAAFVRARAAGEGEALAHERVRGEAGYRAVVVVREESDVRSLADLADRVLALTDPESTTGQLLPLAGLREAGLEAADLRAIRYEDRQEEVVRAVQMREVDAGAVREETARRHEGRGLRVIWHSEPLPGPVLVARTGLDTALCAALREAVTSPLFGPGGKAAPTYAPVVETELDDVSSLMERVYGPGALFADLELPEASRR